MEPSLPSNMEEDACLNATRPGNETPVSHMVAEEEEQRVVRFQPGQDGVKTLVEVGDLEEVHMKIDVEEVLQNLQDILAQGVVRVEALERVFRRTRKEFTQDLSSLFAAVQDVHERLTATVGSTWEAFREQGQYNTLQRNLIENTWKEVLLQNRTLTRKIEDTFQEVHRQLREIQQQQTETKRLDTELHNLTSTVSTLTSDMDRVVELGQEWSDMHDAFADTTATRLQALETRLTKFVEQQEKKNLEYEAFHGRVTRGFQHWADQNARLRGMVVGLRENSRGTLTVQGGTETTTTTDTQKPENPWKSGTSGDETNPWKTETSGDDPFGRGTLRGRGEPAATVPPTPQTVSFPPLAPATTSSAPHAERVNTITHSQGLLTDSTVDGSQFIRGLASIDPKVRELLAKTVALPHFSGKGEDWDDFVLSWNRWWPLSGLPDLCKGEVFKETLPVDMRNQVDKLISRDNWTYTDIFNHFSSSFSGHKNRFSLRDRWESCRCPEKPTVLSFNSWYTTWVMVGKQIEGLTAQQIIDQFIRSLPVYWVKKLVHEIRKREIKLEEENKNRPEGSKKPKWGRLDELRDFMEGQLRIDEFVGIVKDQYTGQQQKYIPPKKNPITAVHEASRSTDPKSNSDPKPCPACNKPGHDVDKCWTKHPEKKPEWLKRSRSAPARTAGRLSQEEMNALKKQGRCFWCKREGHIANKCPDKKKEKVREIKSEEATPVVVQAEK